LLTERRLTRARAPLQDPFSVNLYGVVGGISLLCVALVVARMVYMGNTTFRFMLWNLFLAWLPVVVSLLAMQSVQRLRRQARMLVVLLLGIGWLLLYPNAPYLTTDFIHLIFRWYHPDSLILWYDLVAFFLFSWCGLLLGYMSLRHFHAIVQDAAGKMVGWLFVGAASYLGGFGIYLGRVARLNSWDALFSPFRLIEGVIDGLNLQAFIFTVLFGTLILILYASLFALRRG